MASCPTCRGIMVEGRCLACGQDLRALIRLRYERGAPGSIDLSEQAWYNVCRFYPSIARRARRPMVKVGPEHPLHKTSRAGFSPLPRPSLREPGQDDEENPCG